MASSGSGCKCRMFQVESEWWSQNTQARTTYAELRTPALNLCVHKASIATGLVNCTETRYVRSYWGSCQEVAQRIVFQSRCVGRKHGRITLPSRSQPASTSCARCSPKRVDFSASYIDNNTMFGNAHALLNFLRSERSARLRLQARLNCWHVAVPPLLHFRGPRTTCNLGKLVL